MPACLLRGVEGKERIFNIIQHKGFKIHVQKSLQERKGEKRKKAGVKLLNGI